MCGLCVVMLMIKDLVFVGGGYVYVYVLKLFVMMLMLGVWVMLIVKDLYTSYLGMLLGVVAGYYEDDEMCVDLELLCWNGGFRIVYDEVIGIDYDDG